MREYTKEQFLNNLIRESLEVDEMAAPDINKTSWNALYSKPQGDTGEYRVRKEPHLGKTAEGEHIGHKIVDKTTGEHVYIFYPCDSEIEEFKRKHQSALDDMKAQFGDLYIRKNANIPCREPRITGSDSMDIYHLDTDEKRTIDNKVRFASEIGDAEYLKTYLIYPYLNEYLATPQLQQHLKNCGLPQIKVNDRAHLDNHSKFGNTTFTYQTLNFNSYADVRDFFDAALLNVSGAGQSPEEVKFREHHLARQFNKLYSNWSKDKKSSGVWQGFTEVYGLERRGHAPTTFDTLVNDLVTITGNILHNDGDVMYKLTATFKSEHGKNIRTSENLERMKLNEDYNITKETTVQLPNDIVLDEFNKKDLIAKNEQVQEGLRQILIELREDIMAIPTQDQLVRAQIHNFQLSDNERDELKRKRAERLALMQAQAEEEDRQSEPEQGEEQPQLNEAMVDMIVKNVLSRIK
jgi:hypothetical protein